MKKNIVLTFIFSLLPGCGQMYQGYMKRGVSLLFWAAVLIGVGVMLQAPIVIAPVVVIWGYSFFDCYNLRNLSDEQRAVFYDETLPSRQWLQEHRTNGNKQSSGRMLGWALVVGGILLILPQLQRLLWNFLPDVAYWTSEFYIILLALVLIFFGVRMLRRPAAPPADDDEVQPYRRLPAPEGKEENSDEE